MVSSAPFILVPLWIYILTQACRGEEELPREAVLSWFKERVLEGLGLEEPPPTTAPDTAQPEESRRATRRAPRTEQDITQDCASSDSAPGETSSSHFTYYFEPSMNNHENLVTSAHFWFYMGEGATANSSAQLFILTSAQQLLHVAEDPSTVSSDGWTTYQMGQHLLASVAEGPFLLQVTIPWSPSAIDLLQRPSQERPQHSDCHRAEIEISFEELGWDNWIVHPKVLTFYYCHWELLGMGSNHLHAGDHTVLRSSPRVHEVPEDHHDVRLAGTRSSTRPCPTSYLKSVLVSEQLTFGLMC
ncbi:Inhibin alpha chain Precursor [Larimichthys crocea]|uniref:Inhibin alpha chain n=1 Tax=Larimichthys crocea TaxID=215358 RepID=A0A6G0HHP2_LARCR|nr:Inhibin alpha chain Precursor [Larimichthys crocea]